MKYAGFIYEWTNMINGKKYIGSHKGKDTDSYIASGSAFLHAYRKYGAEKFQRTILEYVENADSILERETYYLKKYDVGKNRSYYNLKDSATGGHCVDYEKTRIGWKRWALENLMKKVYKFDLYGNFIEEFDSLTAAAQSVNAASPSNIKYSCEGKFSTAHGYLWSYSKTPPDIGDPLKTKGKKKVETPDGIFESVSAAQKYYGFSSTKMIRDRCLSTKDKWNRWKYVI